MANIIINTLGDNCNPVSKYRSNAINLGPSERKALSIETLAGVSAISDIADRNNVSRKFVYRQKKIAVSVLDQAFEPVAKSDEILFYLPVTKKWISQFVLALILICHSSFRGVIEILESLFDYRSISLGTIHNIVMGAAEKAAAINANEDLSGIRYGALDEIFQNTKPVLVGIDVESTYCYLLSAEDHRDETTWGVHLLELSRQGLDPLYTIADGGKGLRAGQTAAWPDTPCHGDVFHAERELGKLAYFLENRAGGAVARREKVKSKMVRAKKRMEGQKYSKALAVARLAEESALQLAHEIRILSDWMRDDILCSAGPDLATRCELFDFIVAELEKRQDRCPYKIGPVRRMLENQRDVLLAFVNTLEKRFIELSNQLQIPLRHVHAVCELQGQNRNHPLYWKQREILQNELKDNFF